MNKKIVLVSGGFDPIHSGHISLINGASKHGNVVVLLNSDQWLQNKKGKEFSFHYIFSGAEIPKMVSPFKNTIRVASTNISLAAVNDLSSVTTFS